ALTTLPAPPAAIAGLRVYEHRDRARRPAEVLGGLPEKGGLRIVRQRRHRVPAGSAALVVMRSVPAHPYCPLDLAVVRFEIVVSDWPVGERTSLRDPVPRGQLEVGREQAPCHALVNTRAAAHRLRES